MQTMQTHIVENGRITNIILASVAEAQTAYPDAVCLDAELHPGGIGWVWDGSALTAPVVEPLPVIIPNVVTMRQARLALLAAGRLQGVSDLLASLTGPEGEAARIEWEFATEVRRDWPLLQQLAPALNLSSSDLDNLFLNAETL